MERNCNIAAGGNKSLNAFGHITEHQLRHTYCTKQYEMGIDLLTAKEYMGHEDVKTTLSIYTHLTEERKKISESAVRGWDSNAKNKRKRYKVNRNNENRNGYKVDTLAKNA